MPRSPWCLVVLGLFFCPSLFAQAASNSRHPVTIDDLFQLKEVQDPQFGPDGGWIAYTVKTSSLKEDKNLTRIWMVPAKGGEPVALTAEGRSSSHPRFSPDGRYIAFLSSKDEGKQQVWLLNRLGGDAEQLTSTPQDVEDFEWAPDGKRLVLVLRDASAEELQAAKDEKSGYDSAAKKTKTRKPWVIDRVQFKMDTIGYLDRRRTHLYVFDLATKTMTQITSGDYDDSQPVWSPEGQRIAFTSNRSKPDPDLNYNTDVWTVDANNADKGAHLIQVTTNSAADDSPVWSPDGSAIAYVAQLDDSLFQYATKQLLISPAAGGQSKVLTLALDRMVSEPRFAPDGKSIYFIIDDDGTQQLCRVALSTGEITRPIGGRQMVYSFALSKAGEIAAQISYMDRPSEIYTLHEGQLDRVTHTNDAVMSHLELSQGEYVHFTSKDGTTVAGYLYQPVGKSTATPAPALLRPHGGPVWAWYAEFQGQAQLFAANGYAVLLPNPRGSSGYGQKYCAAIFADWGNHDFQDDMAFVDYAVAQGIADPNKLGVGGWSYGGISTNFIITQTTRFKAAISGASEFLYITNWGHDHYQRDWVYELGLPWEHRENWERISPFNHLTKITTPTLVMGGDVDVNVPVINGEQLYQSLKRCGVPTELVVYPGEYHAFTTPSHVKDRLQRYLDWYNHYVLGQGAATPEGGFAGE